MSLSCSGLDRILSCPALRLVKDGVELKRVSVMRSFEHSDGDVVLRFKEVVGVDEAETLRGAYVAVKASDRQELPPDTFYSDDLLGLAVVTPSGEPLGQVEEVMDDLANGVCVVRQGDRETLVPMLKTVVREVDLKARRMVVELPEEVDAETAD